MRGRVAGAMQKQRGGEAGTKPARNADKHELLQARTRLTAWRYRKMRIDGNGG
jgi:hypothetical protein